MVGGCDRFPGYLPSVLKHVFISSILLQPQLASACATEASPAKVIRFKVIPSPKSATSCSNSISMSDTPRCLLISPTNQLLGDTVGRTVNNKTEGCIYAALPLSTLYLSIYYCTRELNTGQSLIIWIPLGRQPYNKFDCLNKLFGAFELVVCLVHGLGARGFNPSRQNQKKPETQRQRTLHRSNESEP